MSEKIVLNMNYWDCECIDNYIHPRESIACPYCGAEQEDQPDARANEVEEGSNMAVDYIIAE